ncbi:hypothetical protein CDAR_217171 [Caerostris darwini]|uniref:Uncharacterized protein n=1 Tax=Caerostris darwini TaxID=1538125 RepID=A0AAV4UU26_9ARAC|nr:hypothetical protein CDAR_217171 [Caerostris darwini]
MKAAKKNNNLKYFPIFLHFYFPFTAGNLLPLVFDKRRDQNLMSKRRRIHQTARACIPPFRNKYVFRDALNLTATKEVVEKFVSNKTRFHSGVGERLVRHSPPSSSALVIPSIPHPSGLCSPNGI